MAEAGKVGNLDHLALLRAQGRKRCVDRLAEFGLYTGSFRVRRRGGEL